MKKCNKTRRAYVAPLVNVIVIGVFSMICASGGGVIPDAGTSTGGDSSSWNNTDVHDGGSIFFGDETTVAPGKKADFWMDEN